MSDSIFDLEQQIQECRNVTSDLDMVTKYFLDDPKFADIKGETWDEMANKYFAIKELYELKFERMWATFETVCKEYHSARKMADNNRDKELQETMVVSEVYRNNNNERICQVTKE